MIDNLSEAVNSEAERLSIFMFFSKKSKPEEVFTPRSPEVNSEMYIARPDLERSLKNALRGNLHIIIHGESGTGKSWLYKQYFSSNGIKYGIANLANARRLGSITKELENIVSRNSVPGLKGIEESSTGGAMVGVPGTNAKMETVEKNTFEVGQAEPFERCLSLLREQAGDKPCVLVLDNLEAAFSEPLLQELADLIILCDDERYSQYKVKMLIVGVPSGLKEYYYKTPHHATVSNRLLELPEVSRLTVDECETLIVRGFRDKLKYKINQMEDLVRHVTWVTDRLPQMIHEYCLEVAIEAEDEREVNVADFAKFDDLWVSKSYSHAYAVIEEHMNERDTKAGRRNQTLYSLSLCEGEQFKAPEVELILRAEFPSSTLDTALNVPQVLSQLAGENPVIRRSPKGDAYTFADPVYRMVLRSMLVKTGDERVEKMPLSRKKG